MYDQLRDLARGHLIQERTDHTLQQTSLVHELYIKLSDYEQARWNDRKHFFAIASHCMRQILVDYAHKKTSGKRGGNLRSFTLDEERLNLDRHAEELIELDDLIEKLSRYDERKGKITEMRIFCGMTIPEIAEALETSPRTVDREWFKAKTWILKETRLPGHKSE